MRHQHVPIPIALRPFARLSRLLFRMGWGDWTYRFFGAITAMGGGVNVFGHYVPTANDIIIDCNSRSGTYWMMQIAYFGDADYSIWSTDHGVIYVHMLFWQQQ